MNIYCLNFEAAAHFSFFCCFFLALVKLTPSPLTHAHNFRLNEDSRKQ